MKKHTYKFPETKCRDCPHYQETGGILNLSPYCGGFKRRKPKRFQRSDPAVKIPQWCPRRLSPMICRIYGFANECAEYMEMLTIANFDSNEPYIYPLESHYMLRRETTIDMNAQQFFQAEQSESLEDILSDFDLSHGEVIEIDDGLKPYYFCYFGLLRLIPVPIFHPFRMAKNAETKEEY